MNNLRIPAAALALALAAPAHAVEPQVAAQLASLTSQVLTLQGEVAALKAMLNQDGSGNVTQTAAGDRLERVGRNESTAIGQSSARQVGGSSSETVAVDRSTRIGRSDNLAIQRDSAVTIGGNQSHQVARSANVAAGHDIVITAGDQLTLRSGTATIQLRKDGTVVISGVDIQVKGSGDVVVKGARTLRNN